MPSSCRNFRFRKVQRYARSTIWPWGLNRLSRAYRATGQVDLAETISRRALKIEREIVVADPSNKSFRLGVAAALEDLALIEYSDRYPSRDNPAAAIPYAVEILEIQGGLFGCRPARHTKRNQ